MKTHLDLFSGIGGFALAAHWAGFQTIGFCEYEDYPRAILAKHWPGVQCHGDIRDLDGTAYRGVTLVTGGFPCQPFSVAGKQKGATDDRYLWPEMLRVIAQAQPDWVVAENVVGIVTLALDQVLTDLEGEGYACGTVVLPACAVDAPHRRDRVWIIGRNTNSNGGPTGSVNAKTPKLPGDVAYPESGDHRNVGQDIRQASGEVHASSHAGGFGRRFDRLEDGADVADTDSSGMERSWSEQQAAGVGRESENVPEQGKHKRPVGLHNRAGSTPDSDWWAVEPGMGRVAHGIPNRVDRIKGLGNAIVPQVAYEIIKQLN